MSWRTVPLKRIAAIRVSNVDKNSSDDQAPVRLCNYTDVYYRDTITPDQEFMAATASAEQMRSFRLVPGDVVITKDSETADDIGVPAFVAASAADLICGYHLAILRPNSSEADGRYLFWLMSSQAARNQLEVAATGVTRFGLRMDAIGDVRLGIPDVGQQRAIADFLDTETARIDALVSKKRRLIELLDERRSMLIDAALCRRGFSFPTSLTEDLRACQLPDGWQVMHLSAALEQLTNGYVGPTRDLLVDEGVRYVQSLHIKNGRIDFNRRPFYVPRQWHHERARIHLREGDVLIVQTGDIGQVAVVPPDFGEASCHALQIARVRTDLMSGAFLGALLRTPFGYQSLLSRATGALHPHLEGGIRDVPLVVPPRAVQLEILREIEAEEASLVATRQLVIRQIDLLLEHRLALITAAVSGELDAPGVAA